LLSFLSTGFFIIDTDEEGIILRFGKYVKETKPGLNYKFPYLDVVERVSVTRIKKDIIGKFSHDKMFKYLLDEQVRENDITYPKESQMLTGDENIIDMHFYIQWKISNAKNYLFNIKDNENDNIVRSAAESVMRQVISEVTLSEALSEKRLTIEHEVKSCLQRIMDSYSSGIEIVNLGILYSYVGPEVRDAYRDVQSAKADRERFINQAQAYRNEIIPKARAKSATIMEKAIAYKESIVSKAYGDTDKFDKIFQSYVIDKEITKKRMYLDAMEKIYINVNKIIIDKDLSKAALPIFLLDQF
jgi:membrane protease subunit HflK